jgi:hypothetical protein
MTAYNRMIAIRKLLYCLLIASVSWLATNAAAARQDVRAASRSVSDSLNAIIGDAVLADSLFSIHRRGAELPASEQFDFLAEWTLTPRIRMAAEFQTGAGDLMPELVCPAIDLVTVAGSAGQLDDLAERVSFIDATMEDQQAAKAVMQMLIEFNRGNLSQAAAHVAERDRLIGERVVGRELQSPLLAAGWALRQQPELRQAIGAILFDQYGRLLMSAETSQDYQWVHQVAGLIGLYQHLAAGHTENSFGQPRKLQYWVPSSVRTDGDRGVLSFPTHWRCEETTAQNLSGSRRNLLFYRTPLSGNFEVSLEMSDYAFQQIRLLYGGQSVLPDSERGKLIFSNLRDEQQEAVSPKLKKGPPWVRLQMLVHDGVCEPYLNGRLIAQRLPEPNTSPWLAVQCDSPFHGSLRTLRIPGQPDVPETVPMISGPSLEGWYSHYDEFVAKSRNDWYVDALSDVEHVLVGRAAGHWLAPRLKASCRIIAPWQKTERFSMSSFTNQVSFMPVLPSAKLRFCSETMASKF